MAYRAILTEHAEEGLRRVLADNPRLGKAVDQRIANIEADPLSGGQPLVGDLAGLFRSVFAVHYRMVYRTDAAAQVVVILAIDKRLPKQQDDVYDRLRRRE